MSEHAHVSVKNKGANDKDLSPKKLRKRYHKLEEELEDAQEALEEAQEDLKEAQQRVQRNERRVQKRTARIQKIKQKLLTAQHALDGDLPSDAELASLLEEDVDTSTVSSEEAYSDGSASLTPIEEILEPVASVAVPVDDLAGVEEQAIQGRVEEESSEPAVVVAPVEGPLAQQSVSSEEIASEVATSASLEEIAETAPIVLDGTSSGLASEEAVEGTGPDLETVETVQVLESPPEHEVDTIELSSAPTEISEPVALLNEPSEQPLPTLVPQEQELPVESRYGLRSASFPAERQTDEIVVVRVPASLRTSIPEESAEPVEDTSVPVPQDEQPSTAFAAIASVQEQVVTTESQEIIAEANAVAEAAEDAADLAADRLFEFEQRLDQFVAGRHLEQELAQMQAEVERSEHFAREARKAVDSVSMQTALVEPAPLPAAQPEAELFDSDAAPLELSVPPTTEISATVSSDDLAPSLEQIDKDEEVLEAAVSASITNTARRESERVEAYAEASGARTQEARALVERVSMMVNMVVSAIDSGILTGENADEAMAAAEQEMSSAQAVLTALEIITERADSYSAEVEATAEVSGGMSYAAEENWHNDTRVSNDRVEAQHELA